MLFIQRGKSQCVPRGGISYLAYFSIAREKEGK